MNASMRKNIKQMKRRLIKKFKKLNKTILLFLTKKDFNTNLFRYFQGKNLRIHNDGMERRHRIRLFLENHPWFRVTALAASLTLALGLAEPVFAADTPAPVWRTDATASVTESHDLIRLVPGGLATAVKLTGSMPTQYFDFGVRADEIVSKATLDLTFTPSPCARASATAWASATTPRRCS